MKVYVASSWRNERQPAVVAALREIGCEVYDFKNPGPGDNGFHWSEIDAEWKSWTPEQFAKALEHPIAREGFGRDMTALMDADLVVLVLPCGRSAHLEAGYGVGRDKTVFVLVEGDDYVPELMYRMFDGIALTLEKLVERVRLMFPSPTEAGEPTT